MFGATDLPACFADMGVAVVGAASDTTTGLLDRQNVQVVAPETGALLDVLHVTVTIQTGTMAVAIEDTITVDGTHYKVRNINPVDDGQLTELVVTAA